jgi:hypothetical protein
MSREHCQLFHLRLFPDNDLILGVAMCTHQLVHVFRVNEVAHLAACVNPMERLASESVPETNTPVSCTTSATHSSVLVRRPSDRFHCCHMLVKFHLGLVVVSPAPYHQLVVIATRG